MVICLEQGVQGVAKKTPTYKNLIIFRII